MQLDVPKYIRRLRAGGVSEDLAMTHAEAVTGLVGDGLATRGDLHSFTNDLLTEINHVRDTLRAELYGIRDTLRAEFNGALDALEQRLSAKLEALELKIQRDMLALENRLLLKFGAMLAAGIGFLAALQVFS